MREAKDSGEVAGARLRAVLDGGAAARAIPEHGPLDWADIVPAWSSEGDDVPPLGVSRSGDAPGVSRSRAVAAGAGGSRGSSAYLWDTASGDAGSVAEPPGEGLSGNGAFGGARRQWLSAFDPGRPGVRALAAVAVVVVLVAGFLAWRARPRVDPVVPGPDGAVAASGSVRGPGTERGPGSTAGPGSGPVPGSGSGPAPGEVVVAVGGKVRRPGLVRLAPGARVADALAAAGGAEPGVDVALLNLARRVADGELIMVGVTPPPGTPTGPGPGTGAPGASGGPVNLNTATLAQLDGLPGVGPVLAQRILDAREAQGGFRGVSDLRKVDGIGQSRYEQLKDLVTV